MELVQLHASRCIHFCLDSVVCCENSFRNKFYKKILFYWFRYGQNSKLSFSHFADISKQLQRIVYHKKHITIRKKKKLSHNLSSLGLIFFEQKQQQIHAIQDKDSRMVKYTNKYLLTIASDRQDGQSTKLQLYSLTIKRNVGNVAREKDQSTEKPLTLRVSLQNLFFFHVFPLYAHKAKILCVFLQLKVIIVSSPRNLCTRQRNNIPQVKSDQKAVFFFCTAS